jgi:hypothetical protein
MPFHLLKDSEGYRIKLLLSSEYFPENTWTLPGLAQVFFSRDFWLLGQ